MQGKLFHALFKIREKAVESHLGQLNGFSLPIASMVDHVNKNCSESLLFENSKTDMNGCLISDACLALKAYVTPQGSVGEIKMFQTNFEQSTAQPVEARSTLYTLTVVLSRIKFL